MNKGITILILFSSISLNLSQLDTIKSSICFSSIIVKKNTEDYLAKAFIQGFSSKWYTCTLRTNWFYLQKKRLWLLLSFPFSSCHVWERC